MRLREKVALITGAGRGIGEAIAAAFRNEGAAVVISDIDEASAREAARRIGVQSLRLDVRSEKNWQGAVETVLSLHGRLDILVNNAAITGLEHGAAAHDPEHAELADWRAVHETNLDGVFLGCKYGIRTMRTTGKGSIINMSSRSGNVGIPAAAAYASSKAAVRNHTKSVALYCAEQGLAIRCNSIHPGAILTPMWEPLLGNGADRPARMAELVADTPLRRFGQPSEVAALAVMLASDDAAYITGAEFHIDGGLLAGSAVQPKQPKQPKQ